MVLAATAAGRLRSRLGRLIFPGGDRIQVAAWSTPMKVTMADIQGVLGMLPTPSTSDADRWDCTHSVDLDETARMVAMIAGAGVRILLTNGSFGEGATLTADEQRDFTACIAQTLSGAGLLFAGVTTLNTRETIARARLMLDAGADGLFLGRPMWMSLDQAGIVRYYADIAEAVPGVPLIIYDNEFAFKAKIATDTYAELARNPAIVATKHIGGPAIADDLRAVEGRLRVLPVDARWHDLAHAFPQEVTACWSGNAADGPEVLALLADAVSRRDWKLTADLCERMAWAQAPMFPGGKLENFIDYNIPIAHARLEGSGRVRTGPPRPPYREAPPSFIEGGRETGRRWASLRDAFADPLRRLAA
jgi:4-(2-carboxyphenyl)-2-oxobut-3-enoate aldolase